MRAKTRGKTEEYCLDQIKKDLQGILPFWQRMECPLSTQNQVVRQAILTAIPNPQSSSFPDFLFDGGYIEHFQVTAAKENKKGSALKKDESIFEKECQESFRQLENELERSTQREMIVKKPQMTFTENSYDNFVSSFKKNWKHHIESLEKYTGEKRIGIFLVENSGATFRQMKDGRYLGNLYFLHLDKILLPFIYEFRDQIQFTIFKNAQFYEIIETDEIPKLLKTIPQGLYFEPGRMIIGNTQIGINL